MMVLFKGRTALPDGTERTWHGQKFKKINGKWKPIGATRGRGRPRKDSQPRKEAEEEEKEPKKEPEEETKVEKKPDEEPKVDKKPEADEKKKNKKIEIDTSKHDELIEMWEGNLKDYKTVQIPDAEAEIAELEKKLDDGLPPSEYYMTQNALKEVEKRLNYYKDHVKTLEQKIKKEKIAIKQEMAAARGTKLGRKKSPEKLFAEELVAKFDAEDHARREMKGLRVGLKTNNRNYTGDEIAKLPDTSEFMQGVLLAMGVKDLDEFEKIVTDAQEVLKRDEMLKIVSELESQQYQRYGDARNKQQEYAQTHGEDEFAEERRRLSEVYIEEGDKWNDLGRVRSFLNQTSWIYNTSKHVREEAAKNITAVYISNSYVGLEMRTKTGERVATGIFEPDEALAMVSAFMKGSAREKYMLAIKNSELYQSWELKSGKSPLGETLKQYEAELGVSIKLQDAVALINLEKRGSLKKLRKNVEQMGSIEKRKLFFDECMNVFTTLKKHMDMTKYVPPDGKKLNITILPSEGNEAIGGCYSEYDTTINIKPTTKGAITHEIGHYFWERSKEMQKEFMQWVEDSGLKKKIDENTYDPRENDDEWDNYIDTTITNGIREAEKRLDDFEVYTKNIVSDREGLRNGTQVLGAFLIAKAKSEKGYFEKGRRRHHDSAGQYAPKSAELEPEKIIDIINSDEATMMTIATTWKDKYLPDMDVSTIYTQLLGLRSGMAEMHKHSDTLSHDYANKLTNGYSFAIQGGGVNYKEGADYWKTPTEIFARTFRNFIANKATGMTDYRMSDAVKKVWDSDYPTGSKMQDAEYKEYKNTYGWGFPGVDPDAEILNYGDGALEKIYNKYIGNEVIKSLTRLVWLLDKSLTYNGHKLHKRCKIHGMKISIENKKGSVRSGVDKDGHKWETKMHYDYGYIRGTVGKDKDHLDCYVGPDPESGNVFIVHQNDPVKGTFDEDKVMLGFNTPEEAKEAYLKQYDRSGFFGSMDATDIETFKKEIYKNKNKGRRLVIRKSKMSELASALEDQGLYRKGMKKTWTPEQEEEGIEVELEHTGDREVARQIAMDHLVEDVEYYKKLKKMEG